jgi:hypothetical protein
VGSNAIESLNKINRSQNNQKARLATNSERQAALARHRSRNGNSDYGREWWVIALSVSAAAGIVLTLCYSIYSLGA